MSEFIDRENTIFAALAAANDAGLEYVVVGGYAVSAYAHRFSVDADLVVAAHELDAFATMLEDQGFTKAVDIEFDAYDGKFVAYEQDADLPVSIDLLVDGVTSRQTDASWSYEYILEHAARREIAGTQRRVTAPVVDPPLLIALKLHSGRLTDLRDVVALTAETDLDPVRDHLVRGDTQQLRSMLESGLATLADDGFADSFRGVFVREELPTDTIDRVVAFLEDQLEVLDSA